MENDHRDRFLHLETQRREEDQPARQESAPPHAQFREVRETSLELDRHPNSEQPFHRCAQCECDNILSARECRNCGVPLDTPEQQTFNRTLWRHRRKESLTEQSELALAHRRRDEEKARSQARAEEAERNGRWGGGNWDGDVDRRSIAVRLFALIPNRAARVMAMLLTVGLLSGVVYREMNRVPQPNWYLLCGSLALLSLFLTGRSRWRRSSFDLDGYVESDLGEWWRRFWW